MYGLYKPFDSIHTTDNVEIPTFAKNFFGNIETNEKLLKFFSYYEKTQEPKLIELQSLQRVDDPNITPTPNEFNNYLSKQTARASIFEQENFLENQLPKRAVTISKKIIKRFLNQNDSEIYYFYQIITQIDQQHYISEKRYPDFIQLASHLTSQEDILHEKFPILQKIDLKQNEDEISYIIRRGEIAEQWLKEQFKNPLFITNELLNFLSVDDKAQLPFITYAQQKRRIKDLTKKKVRQYSEAQSRLSARPSNFFLIDELTTSPTDNYISQHLNDLSFTSWCQDFEYGQFGTNSLLFVVNIQFNNQNQQNDLTYRILKSMSSIKSFSKNLENQLGRSLPQTMNPNLQVQKTNQDKIKFVDTYFKNLLDNQDFYCKMLFEFINFDVIQRCESKIKVYDSP